MIPVIVKLCESPSRAGGLLMINQISNVSRWKIIKTITVFRTVPGNYLSESVYMAFLPCQ